MNYIKALLGFGLAILVIGLISLVISSMTSSTAWSSIVPDGLAKYVVILLPIIMLLAALVIAIKKATGGNNRNRRY